nr:hypothetical protein [Tanacetum cinerariifolium]
MAPAIRQATKTKIGEEVLDLVIPYTHNVDGRSSVSLVSRNFYEVEGITRKHLTVHVHYYPKPTCLSKRFPFIELLTLKGPPPDISQTHYDPDIRITPWIEQLALEFRCSKELCILRLVVHDEDLETLARTRGMDLKSLKIKKCKGFSTYGLMHVSKYCIQLRTLCLKYCYHIEVKDSIWLHQLALKSTILERFHVTNMYISKEDVTHLTKNCCNSLISLKIEECYLNEDHQCLLFTRCTNLEALCTIDGCGDRGLQIIGKLCKKLRKLTHYGLVTHVGLISLAKGCTNLESLDVKLGNISNKALECVGTHLKNLGDFCMHLVKDDGTTGLLENGIQAMLMGCRKLERLDFSLRRGRLTDVGLEYIGKYGVNLRSLHLERVGNSNAGLVKLSQGCQKLRKLKLFGCPFSEQVVASYVFNIPSLRYVLFDRSDRDGMCLTRPDFQV